MDPLVILLFLIAALLTWAQAQQRIVTSAAIAQAGSEARLFELRWALGEQFGKTPELPAKVTKNQWDAAVETVLLAERGRLKEALERLPHAPGGVFRACWEAAYNSGTMPEERDIAIAIRGLGGGLASKYLEASLVVGEEEAADKMRADALRSDALRALALFSGMTIVLAGAIAGIGIGVSMLIKREPVKAPPRFQMSNIFAIRVCLGWYILFLASATIAGLVNSVISLGVFVLPTTYLLHAASGIAFICVAENISPLTLWKKLSAKNRLWVFKGIKYLLLALGAVSVLTVFLSLFTPESGASQNELINFIRDNSGFVSFLIIFVTVALIGPIFEEIFFRGYLLSVLRRRLSTWWALAVSSALFGAIHFQAQTFPVLAFLGFIMGLALLRTGDIKTAVFVHGCWNGGVFLFQSLLLGV
jgi:membrane protease YdiL (CAAX protease family)